MERRRLPRVTLLISLPLITFLLIYMFYTPALPPRGPSRVIRAEHTACAFRVLYYDPLALEHPNDTLLRVIRDVVVEHGGCIDAFIGRAATLAPLMNISRYDIVVIRAHGGIWRGKGFYFATGVGVGEAPGVPRSLFERLVKEGAVEAGSPAVWGRSGLIVAPEYIVVGASFFKHVRFRQGAVVILASCNSLDDPRFVRAVLSAGARAYIGWAGDVTPADIDAVLPKLVDMLAAHLSDPCEAAKLFMMRLGGLLATSTGAVMSVVCGG